jgi:hypothetical protein
MNRPPSEEWVDTRTEYDTNNTLSNGKQTHRRRDRRFGGVSGEVPRVRPAARWGGRGLRVDAFLTLALLLIATSCRSDRSREIASRATESWPAEVIAAERALRDIRGDEAERIGYVNRSLPDAELDSFVDALATRIASFDKWAIANTKRLVNAASLPPDIEIAAGWDACISSIGRPAAQERIKALMDQGFHKPGDAENRLGYYAGKFGR